ncbi:MAG: hypothetical protein ACYC46_01435 [Acidobacteriaceae bacterium]
MGMQLSYKIWFAGCVVWLIDCAVSLHYGSNAHAAVALVIAVLFLAAGIFFQKNQ